MDNTGFACSRFNIYGQRIWVVHHILPWIINKLLLTHSSMSWTFLFLELKLYLIARGNNIYIIWRWCDILSLELFFFSTSYMQVKLTGRFLLRMLPSSNVCIYSGNRLLQSTYLIMRVQFYNYFLPMTHMLCVMFYIVACYCIDCMSYCTSVVIVTVFTVPLRP